MHIFRCSDPRRLGLRTLSHHRGVVQPTNRPDGTCVPCLGCLLLVAAATSRNFDDEFASLFVLALLSAHAFINCAFYAYKDRYLLLRNAFNPSSTSCDSIRHAYYRFRYLIDAHKINQSKTLMHKFPCMNL